MPAHYVTLSCGTRVEFCFQRALILPGRALFSRDSMGLQWIIKFSNVTPLMRNSPRIGATILKRKIEAELNASLSVNIVSSRLHIVNNQLEFHIRSNLMDTMLCRLTADSATSFCKTIGKLLEAEYIQYRAVDEDVMGGGRERLSEEGSTPTSLNSPTPSL